MDRVLREKVVQTNGYRVVHVLAPDGCASSLHEIGGSDVQKIILLGDE
jgi:hypothetical protein